MGRVNSGAVEPVRATHAAVLRRQTPAGDTTLVVHWHEADSVRAWRYTSSASGTTFTFDSTSARLLGPSAHDLFCSGHVSLNDGRLLVVGGTAPGVDSELGTNEISAFDPNQVDLWNASSHWLSQIGDTMRYERWYPTVTQRGDGTLVAMSGVEYFEAPVFGGASPADSTGPFRDFRALGLGRFPAWHQDPMNRDITGTYLPPLKDHTSIVTGQEQFTLTGGRGVVVTFGGITLGAGGTEEPTDQTWWSHDADVDMHNSWRTELMPLAPGSQKPPKRSQHAAGIVETASGLGSHELRMFVYGGRDVNGNALDDVWYLNKPNTTTAATWTQVTPSGPNPGPRYGHTMVFDPGPAPGTAGGGQPATYRPKLLVFGGKRSPSVWAGTDTVFVLELWQQPYTWYALDLSTSGQPRPGPRYRHAAMSDRQLRPGQTRRRMFIFGGAAANGSLLNDTWSLSREKLDYGYTSWKWFSDPAASVPPAVYKHAMVHDEQWDRLLVIGGDRTYEGTGGEGNTGDESNECFVRNVNVFVPDTTWRKLETTSPIVRRSGHSAFYYWPKAVNARPPEKYEPFAAAAARWSPLTDAPKFDQTTYPFMFELPDGRYFYAGRMDSSKMLPSSLSGAWGDQKLGGMVGSEIATATAVQYQPGRVLKVGNDINRTKSVATRADLTGGGHQWDSVSTFRLLARNNSNATVLPNGQILLTGGRKSDGGQDGTNSADPVQVPQLWTPASNSWTPNLPNDAATLLSDPANRGYHSTAILLPDGRVLSAGGNPGENGNLHDAFYHGTIFEPPYLFDPNSSGGNSYIARPTIDVAPKFMGQGCPFTFTVTATNGVSSVCLIRPGAVTHAFNQDQHYVPLSFTQSGSTITVDSPPDPHTAPPGDYLLFVVDNTSRKVPSVGRWLRVAESIGPYQANDVTRPGRTLNLNGSNGLEGPNCSQPVNMTWSAPSDDSTTSSTGRARVIDLRYSTSPICDNCWTAFAQADQVSCEPPAGNPGQAQSVAVYGLTIGSYQFRMVSQDDMSTAANYSGMSNAKTVSVFGCEEEFSGGGGGGGYGFRAGASMNASFEAPEEQPENSLRLPATGVGTDFLGVSPPAADGLLRSHLRRGATGQTEVKEVALVVADHPADREVFRVGGEWRLGSREPALTATNNGNDVAPMLGGDPDLWLVGDTGDTVTVRLAPHASGEPTGAIYLETHAGRIAGVDEPGLRVLDRDTGGDWREVARVLPRSRFATLAVAGIAGDEIRIAFQGNHAIRRIGRLVLDDAPAVSRRTPAELTHSTLGTLGADLVGADGAGVSVGPRERIDFGFAPPADGPAEARSYFLEVTGTSTAGEAVAARARPSGGDVTVPSTIHLGPPMPNPFSDGTSLRLGLPEATHVRADVYDLAGRRMATLQKGSLPAGWHTLTWDGRSRSATRAAAGVYLLRVMAGDRAFDRRLLVMP